MLCTILSLVRKPRHNGSPSAHSQRSRPRLNLECLEERLAPSAIPLMATPAVTPAITTETSRNWSGYALDPGHSVNAVGGTWVQPAITSKSPLAATSIWVGIDGYNSGTVEQLGTNYANGKYTAWIEFYGDQSSGGKKGPYFDETNIPQLTIVPGDVVSAAITYLSSTKTTSTFDFQFSIKETNGKTETYNKDYATSYIVPSKSSGEWIVEAPASLLGIDPLANFGNVSFSGAWATVGKTTGSITTFDNSPIYQLNMVPSGKLHGGVDETSALVTSSNPGMFEGSGTSSSFIVTYESTSGANSNISQSGSVVNLSPTTNGALAALDMPTSAPYLWPE